MSLLLHPQDILKKFALHHESGGMASDTTYFLVFTTGGQLVVRLVKEYEQPHKTPDVQELEAKDFSKTIVGGKILLDLVTEKLRDVLNRSN